MLGAADSELTTLTITLPGDDGIDLREFSKRLYKTHDRIFAGLDEESFFRCVFDSGAETTQIRAFIAPGGEIVGYAAVHCHRTTVCGRRISVYRAQAGFLPRYRAGGRTFWFFLLAVLRCRLRYPLEPGFILGSLIHPSSYVVFARHFPVIFPRRGLPTPPAVQELVKALSRWLDLQAVDASDPFVIEDGWVTRHSDPYWSQTDDLDVAYFRDRNPGYVKGHGLITLVPVTPRNIMGAALRYGRRHGPSGPRRDAARGAGGSSGGRGRDAPPTSGG